MQSGYLESSTSQRQAARRLLFLSAMSRVFMAAAVILLLASTASAFEQPLLARVTVYWARGGHGSDRYTRQHRCATGTRLRGGHCAVDPRRIPYGSKLLFPDGIFTAADTGTAVLNRKAARLSGRSAAERNALVVDRFFETRQEALAWANSHPPFMSLQVARPDDPITLAAARAPVIAPSAPRVASNTNSAAIVSTGIARTPLCRLGR